MLENQLKKGPGKWSRRREAAIVAMLTYDTMAKAAKHIRVAESTLYRWQRDPEFQRAYDSARLNILDLASAELKAGSLEAVKTLREVAANKRAPASARVQACRTFLEACKLLEGLSVSINNQVVPQNPEELNAAIVAQLSGMLKTDVQLRAEVIRILAGLEAKDGNTAREN
jgi:hypothetical protein